MNKSRKASGELVGGNIYIYSDLLGSISIDCRDKILFIEDLR
jgi:muramoyltetrapeptide carboxypeptidase LdcA involved in peptidoglycan recycling